MTFGVEVKRLSKTAIVPKYATEGSAALDLYSDQQLPIILDPCGTVLIGTGVAIHLASPQMAALVLGRSSLGLKGLVLANTVGLIDSDYQGEIKVALYNRSKVPYAISHGDRIAQFLPIHVHSIRAIMVDEFSKNTKRGSGGFGSTGQ